MVDISKVVKTIVESGVEEAKAEKIVKDIYNKLDESGKLEGMSDEHIVQIINIAASKRFAKVDGDEFNAVCIGYSGLNDDFGFAKYQIIQEYKKNKLDAINRGLVRLGDEVDTHGEKIPIPIDNRQYIDNARTIENNNYGKDYPTKMIRQVYFVVDGVLRIAKVNEKIPLPTIGANYKIIGKLNGKYINYIGRMDIEEILSAGEIWDFITDVGGEFDEFVEIEDLDDSYKNKLVILTATISRAGVSGKGTHYVVFESAYMDDGIVGFYSEKELIDAVANSAEEGKEIVLLAKMKLFPDGKPYFEIYGLFHDPETDDTSSMIGEIESMFGDLE